MNLLVQLFPSGPVLGPPLTAFFNDPLFIGTFVDKQDPDAASVKTELRGLARAVSDHLSIMCRR